MAGLPYNCRCFTVTGAVAGMPNPSATGNGGGGGGSVGDKSTPNPNLGVSLPPSAISICNSPYAVPAGVPFLVVASGGGGGGGSNGNYAMSGDARYSAVRIEVTGGAGGSGQPLVAYFLPKPYSITVSAQCGASTYGPGGAGCTKGGSGSNGPDGNPTIVTIGTQQVLLLPGKGGTGGSGGVNVACGYIPPVPLGGYGWKSGGEGSIVNYACGTPTDWSNCWVTNGTISPCPQLPIGGASVFGLGGAQSCGCSSYPNNSPALGAGGSGGGGAHFMNCGTAAGNGYPAWGGASGAAFIILNPTQSLLTAYGLSL